LVNQGVASIAVAVARDGEVLWEQGFGWADRERRLLADEHTPYSLASISKPITATALQVLVERGAFDLDSPVNDYLGPSPLLDRAGDANAATVRRVANHTAGLPLHYHFFPDDEQPVPPPFADTIRAHGVLVTPPGERYHYSNLGYGVLEHSIERVSGKSYPLFMRSEVFLPLSMTRSSVHIGPGLEPYAAARYGNGPAGLRLPLYDFDHRGGSAVWASAHDLLRFGMFHLHQRQPEQREILPGAAIDAMQQATASIDTYNGYGLGWRVVEARGYRSVEHDGGMPGVTTVLQLLISERLAVVVLSNSVSRLPRQVAERIVEAVAPQAAAQRAAIQRSASEARAAAAATAFAPPADLLGEWRGSVAAASGDIPFILRFQPDGDLHARLGSQLWTLVNEPHLASGHLTGVCVGELTFALPPHAPYQLHLDLQQRGDVLNGAVIAMTVDGQRFTDAVSLWAALKRR
jgi:CubicO group peptidase (beta-lactamase class C family)